MAAKFDVYLEIGSKKVFACATDWPGLCRSGKGEEEALEALASYGARYAAVMRLSKLPFHAPRSADELVVGQRLAGNATTDFGAPGITPSTDEAAIDETELARLQKILAASWKAFDAASRKGRGKELKVGPRGGGRSLGKIVDHVAEAEEGYVRQLGSRPVKLDGSREARTAAARDRAGEALAARARGEAPSDPANVKNPWTPRFFVRRAAWHVLDHAWEIEDRIIE